MVITVSAHVHSYSDKQFSMYTREQVDHFVQSARGAIKLKNKRCR